MISFYFIKAVMVVLCYCGCYGCIVIVAVMVVLCYCGCYGCIMLLWPLWLYYVIVAVMVVLCYCGRYGCIMLLWPYGCIMLLWPLWLYYVIVAVMVVLCYCGRYGCIMLLWPLWLYYGWYYVPAFDWPLFFIGGKCSKQYTRVRWLVVLYSTPFLFYKDMNDFVP